MVVKFGQNQSRGAAGQSAFGSKRNFANLYNLNRAQDQTASQVNKMQTGIRGAQSQVDSLGMQAGRKASTGNDPSSQMSQMAGAVERARQGSQAASQYNPAANIMKNGGSAMQAGVGAFYTGGAGAQQRTKKFGGLYDSVKGTADRYATDMPVMLQAGKADMQRKSKIAQATQQQKRNERHALMLQGTRGHIYSRQNKVGRMDNLDYLLKTGRISQRQYYAAQKDQLLYNQLMKRGEGSAGEGPTQ